MAKAKVSANIRVVIADDHAIFREGLRKLLEGAGDIAVVGEAGDGAGTWDRIAGCQVQDPPS